MQKPNLDDTLTYLDRMSYVLEFIKFHNIDYALIRPVLTFNIPQNKGFSLKYRYFPKLNNRGVLFRTVIRIFYKDGERVNHLTVVLIYFKHSLF